MLIFQVLELSDDDSLCLRLLLAKKLEDEKRIVIYKHLKKRKRN